MMFNQVPEQEEPWFVSQILKRMKISLQIYKFFSDYFFHLSTSCSDVILKYAVRDEKFYASKVLQISN